MFKWPNQSLSIPSIVFCLSNIKSRRIRRHCSPEQLWGIPKHSQARQDVNSLQWVQRLPRVSSQWDHINMKGRRHGGILCMAELLTPKTLWSKLISSTRIMNHDQKNQFPMSWPKVRTECRQNVESRTLLFGSALSSPQQAAAAPAKLRAKLQSISLSPASFSHHVRTINHDPRLQTSNQAVNAGGHSWKKPTEPDGTMFQTQMSSSSWPCLQILSINRFGYRGPGRVQHTLGTGSTCWHTCGFIITRIIYSLKHTHTPALRLM